VRGLLLGVGVIGALVMSAPASAHAPDPQDVTAARRLIAAEIQFDHAILSHRAAITTAAKGYAAMVRRRCAGALPESALSGTTQQDRVVKDLVQEAALDLFIAETRSITAAERRFDRALKRVHFTGLSLIIAVGTIAVGSEPVTAMTHLCADVKSAVAAGFAAAPPGTARAGRLGRQLSAGQEPYVPRRITPYLVTPADRAAAKTARALNGRADSFTDGLALNESAPVLAALLGTQPSTRPAEPGLDR
jgi:hypothetical protein